MQFDDRCAQTDHCIGCQASVNCFVRPVCAMQVAEAAKLWDGTGALVFTSSAGLYEVDDGSHCNEDCKIADRGSNERTDR